MEPYERTMPCLYCHEPFTFMQAIGRPKVFCSTDCLKQSRLTGKRLCQHCGEPFAYVVNSALTNVCSTECKAIMDMPRCRHCHGPRPTNNALDDYCSPKCQAFAPKKNCEHCGKETHARKGTLRDNPRFCNQDCRTAWMLDHRPESAKHLRNPRLETWAHEANAAQWPPIRGPLTMGAKPYYFQMPEEVKLSRRMQNSINFWLDVGLPYLKDELTHDAFVVYYVSHGHLPIDMNYRIDLTNTASLWELTPWLYPVLKEYDIAMMRAGTDRHEDDLKRRADRIQYLMPPAEAFNEAVRKGQLGSKQAEVKRRIKKGAAAVDRLREEVQNYVKVASRLATCRGLIGLVDGELFPEVSYYAQMDPNMPDYEVTTAHNEIVIKWMVYRDKKCKKDTEATVGKEQYRELFSALPGTLDYIVGRWHNATVDVVGNVSGLVYETKPAREVEEDWP